MRFRALMYCTASQSIKLIEARHHGVVIQHVVQQRLGFGPTWIFSFSSTRR